MQDIFIGRQAVFDRNHNVTSYELLFRDGSGKIGDDDDYMTSKVLVGALMDMGLDTVSDGKMLHINASTSFLLSGMIEVLPPEKVSIEILESVPITDEVIQACKQLKDKGYHLMLDDVVYDSKLDPLIALVDVVKVEFPQIVNLEEEVRILRQFNVKLLAEKVETQEEYQRCYDLGFDYFQGYFFCKPQTIQSKTIPESKIAILRALQKVIVATAVSDVQEVVKQDVSLSYRLLKYINSAAFGMRREVESIEQALVLLGLNNIRRWLSLLSLSALSDGKPVELMRTALYRGFFLESMAKHLNNTHAGDSFLLGMFSILDALLDQPMVDALEDLALPTDVKATLLHDGAVMSHYLKLVYALEKGKWDDVELWVEKFDGLSLDIVGKLHMNAITWSDQQMEAMQVS